MLGLATALPGQYRSVFLSFSESGRCRPLLEEAQRRGFEAVELCHNFPNIMRSAREIAEHLKRASADLLCTSGYKSDIIGYFASRLAGIPIISISHGWTAATLKVRFNEWIDRLVLRWIDRIICVSSCQAQRVRRAGVLESRIDIVHNAIDTDQTPRLDPQYREELLAMFADAPEVIVGAAGRLSPEKGFAQFVKAASILRQSHRRAGFVIFGDGPLRSQIAAQIAGHGLTGQVVLAGFRPDLDRFLPNLDLLVLPSFTEGLPVILLEAFASGVPAVASAVGGTPEVLIDGECGHLVPPGDPQLLAERIGDLLDDPRRRETMGRLARARVIEHFSLPLQSLNYRAVFDRVLGGEVLLQPHQQPEMVVA